MIASQESNAALQTAEVVSNRPLCREHLRLTIRFDSFPEAAPGQFVHLRPETDAGLDYRVQERDSYQPPQTRQDEFDKPMLRRAFSIAELIRNADGVRVDVIYRVVGKATRWMQSLQPGEALSAMGPLGNAFPISSNKRIAWLVAGGVGLPPMLWLSEALQRAGKETIAFLGARSADLLALTLDPKEPPAADARSSSPCVAEFARHNAAVVISTDDGSLGLQGHVGQAITAFHDAQATPASDLVVYTCGPERMMKFVAEYCNARNIECYACMERSMACGTGLCQSCVVPVNDATDPEGWRYRLCCREGPVFNTAEILW